MFIKRKRRSSDRLVEFGKLSDAEQIEARLSWLEWKMVEVLWGLISLSSMMFSAVVAWIASETFGTRSFWLLIPVFFICFGFARDGGLSGERLGERRPTLN